MSGSSGGLRCRWYLTGNNADCLLLLLLPTTSPRQCGMSSPARGAYRAFVVRPLVPWPTIRRLLFPRTDEVAYNRGDRELCRADDNSSVQRSAHSSLSLPRSISRCVLVHLPIITILHPWYCCYNNRVVVGWYLVDLFFNVWCTSQCLIFACGQ